MWKHFLKILGDERGFLSLALPAISAGAGLVSSGLGYLKARKASKKTIPIPQPISESELQRFLLPTPNIQERTALMNKPIEESTQQQLDIFNRTTLPQARMSLANELVGAGRYGQPVSAYTIAPFESNVAAQRIGIVQRGEELKAESARIAQQQFDLVQRYNAEVRQGFFNEDRKRAYEAQLANLENKKSALEQQAASLSALGGSLISMAPGFIGKSSSGVSSSGSSGFALPKNSYNPGQSYRPLDIYNTSQYYGYPGGYGRGPSLFR